jgi:tRNA nucleotidyltransferase/poly(A) polymerase
MITEIDRLIHFIKKIEKLLDLKLYLVGGAVRDLLLNLPTKDFDFTTDVNPEEIENRIKKAGFKPYLMGKKFGTIGFKIDDELVEITTFRSETYTLGNRKPEVGFHRDIKYDLERRDLTINAMALSSNGDLIDLFDGQVDLKNKIIKCVGDPDQRFSEDPLRMLRAVRFAGQYEFVIEDNTLKSIQKNHWRLLDISKERWVMEMDLILAQKTPDYALDLLLETGLFSIILPEITLLNLPFWDILDGESMWNTLKNRLNSTQTNDISIRWAMLLSALSEPFLIAQLINQNHFKTDQDILRLSVEELENSDFVKNIRLEFAIKIGKHLKFSNHRIDKIQEFIQNS